MALQEQLGKQQTALVLALRVAAWACRSFGTVHLAGLNLALRALQDLHMADCKLRAGLQGAKGFVCVLLLFKVKFL